MTLNLIKRKSHFFANSPKFLSLSLLFSVMLKTSQITQNIDLFKQSTLLFTNLKMERKLVRKYFFEYNVI
jgi:hypothetical protein